MKKRSSSLELSVVLPCLNEAATVAKCVREAIRAMRRARVRGEVVVADNGSTDGSPRIATAAGARVVHVVARGYGAALKGGIRAARGKWAMMADADMSYDLSRIPVFVAGLRKGYDLVQGSRLRGEIVKGAMPWSHRRIGTPFFNLLLRILFGIRVSDSQCGMRAFTRAAFDKLKMRSSGMEFASEMLAKAARLKLKITEVPIRYRPDERGRPPHLRAFADGWRHLRLIMLLSPVSLLLVPGFSMLLPGLGFIAAAAARLEVLGYPVGFHFAILGSALVLIGYQVTHLSLSIALLRRGVAHPSWERLFLKAFSLERVLILGSLLGLAGFLMDLKVLLYWLAGGFPAFSTGMTILGIIGTTLILLGAEIVMAGFFTAALLAPRLEKE